jgi:hypothetical protein
MNRAIMHDEAINVPICRSIESLVPLGELRSRRMQSPRKIAAVELLLSISAGFKPKISEDHHCQVRHYEQVQYAGIDSGADSRVTIAVIILERRPAHCALGKCSRNVQEDNTQQKKKRFHFLIHNTG